MKLPKLGDTSDEVVIVEWYRKVNDVVNEGDPLLRVETDKVEVDIPAAVGGRLIEQLVADGDEVATGSPLATIES